MGFGFIFGKGWAWGRRSEKWYRNQLKKTIIEFADYVERYTFYGSAHPVKMTYSAMAGKEFPYQHDLSRRERKYIKTILELTESMRKYGYQYRDIIMDSSIATFPNHYPVPQIK